MRTITLEEALPPHALGNRFKVAWYALLGRGIMYRIAVQFELSPNFLGQDAMMTECLFQSKDGSMPFFNNSPAAEIIGEDNTWKGMGIWDTEE